MIHSFDAEIAEKYGVNVAILFNHMSYWLQHNEANNKNFYDGEYWTFNSIAAFKEIFPYMGEKSIRNALTKMEDAKLIITGNYNKLNYDRTKWYALGKIGKSICLKGRIEVTQRANLYQI
ncbi:MAG: hypothetical protein ACK5MV_13785 [Aminipila sp.]